MSEEKLAEFLKRGSDWEKLRTSVPGVFIQKLPPYRSSPERLAVEINPIDASGNPTAHGCCSYVRVLLPDLTLLISPLTLLPTTSGSPGRHSLIRGQPV
jgi:hypothetical protein